MNYRYVLRQLGILLGALSGGLLVLAAWSALLAFGLGETTERSAAAAFALTAAIGLTVSGAVWLATRRFRSDLERREALLLVTLTWILGAALGAAPYYFWSHLTTEGAASALAFRSPVNCFFESMSGFTTAGSSILTDIGSLPRSLLLWRATTQWIGGLGIVVLFVAVLPSIGAASKRLFAAESVGVTRPGVRPEVRETARVLWIIYSGLTVAAILSMRLAGMGWFDAVCHAFTTLATGGYSTGDASVGGFVPAVQWIVILFMIAGGINFGLYYQLWRKRWREVLCDTELRVYLAIIAVLAVLATAFLVGRDIISTTGDTVQPGLLGTLRYALFGVCTVQTTTGYATADYDAWPSILRSALVVLLFVGGCSGSTSGGIKVIRVWITIRAVAAGVERAFRPNVIRPMRIGSTVVNDDLRLEVLTYVLAAMAFWMLGTGLLLAIEAGQNLDATTAGTAVIAVFSTVGPGLGRVGPVQNFAWMTDASKLLLCLWMLLGRLEIFPVIALLTIRFWRE
jgi:trk system potassium uptake protein TrkH